MKRSEAAAALGVDLRRLRGLPEGERQAAEKALNQALAAVQANPLLAFRPHAGQVEVMSRQGHGIVRLALGGNRAGKTTGGVGDDLIQLVDRDALPEHLRRFKFWEPPFFLRVVTVDFKETHNVVLDKFRQWTPVDQLRGGSWRRAYDKQERRLWFKNGSFVEFMSQEQDVEAFQGTSRHRIHYDEEPRNDHGKAIWNENAARLIDEHGDTLLSMTPLLGMSWVYDQIYVPWERGEKPHVHVVPMASDDNPHVSKEGLEQFFESLGSMSEAEKESRRKGTFGVMSGAIYPRWSAKEHTTDPLTALPPVGPDRRFTLTCIDPGAANPRVTFLFADDLGRVTVFDELAFPQGAAIHQVCAQILDVERRWGFTPSWRVIDPAARAREQATGRPVMMEYAKYGVVCRLGDNARAVGIGRQKALLEQAGFFRVTENCRELIIEFPKYRWKAAKRSEDAVKEQAVKRDDHSLDTVRYGIMSLPDPGVAEEPVDPVTLIKATNRGPRPRPDFGVQDAETVGLYA